MLSLILGGAIFTDQEVAIFSLVAFIFVSFVSGVFIFACRYIYRRVRNKDKSKLLFVKSILVAFVMIPVAIFVLIIVPDNIRADRWEKKQQRCALEAGYKNPEDDNTDKATSHSQSIYWECLER